jgi:hypothetical protein
MKQLMGDEVSRGIEVTDDVPPGIVGSIFSDTDQPPQIRKDGSMSAAAFNTHLEDLWFEAMTACGETPPVLKQVQAA